MSFYPIGQELCSGWDQIAQPESDSVSTDPDDPATSIGCERIARLTVHRGEHHAMAVAIPTHLKDPREHRTLSL
jgi:hypothetical protein